MPGKIPREVPAWLEQHGRRNARGEWIATCPRCERWVLGDHMRADRDGNVMCTSCKRAGKSRDGWQR